MKRLPLVIAVIVALAGAPSAAALTVTVDGDLEEWDQHLPPGINYGYLVRDYQGYSAYAWFDSLYDTRNDFASPDLRVDMTSLRITADPTALYFAIRIRDIDIVTGDGAPQIQIAMDQDYVLGSGQIWFGANADTQVASQAAWEYLVVTRFGSGLSPQLLNPTWADVSGGAVTAAISDTEEAIEIAVPWSALGGQPAAAYRFTVISLRSGPTDEAWDISGQSDALDCVTSYGQQAATSGNTWDEVDDGVVDHHFEIWFHLDPDFEPSAPLVINEVLMNAVADPGGEWIELYNRTGAALPLAQTLAAGTLSFKVGDEETPDSSEGMYAFPVGGTVATQDVVLIANRADTYATEFPAHPAPDFEFDDQTATPDMVSYSVWGLGPVDLDDANDEVLLIDPFGTVIDAVPYGTGSYHPVTGGTAAPEGGSIERPQPKEDLDDVPLDFVTHAPADITPGAVFAALPNGAGCAGPNYCQSGHCVGNVCCDNACDATCDGGCDGTGTCQPRVCPTPVNDCDLAVCDPVTGCERALNAVCEDNDACTPVSVCDAAGACVGTSTVTCPTPVWDCERAVCDPVWRCLQPTGTPCNDGDACTADTQCSATGSCEGGSEVICPTPTDSCDRATCHYVLGCFAPNGAGSDDGNVCTSGTTCDSAGNCGGGTVMTCPTPTDDCDLAVCDPVTVCAAPAGTPCDDGNVCTTGQQCYGAGICGGGSVVTCPAPNDDCDLAACDPLLGCSVATGTSCDDGDACTTGLQCDGAGGCGGGNVEICPTPANDCQIAVCDATTGCVVASGTVCDDGNQCTVFTTCDASGHCGDGNAVACPTPLNDCMLATCDPTTRCHAVEGTACDDGDRCTSVTTCDASGGCGGGTPLSCPTPTNDCMLAACDSATGCLAATGSACDDSDGCTTGTTCDASGMCGGGTNTCVDGGVPDSGVTPDSGPRPDARVYPDAGPGDDGGGGCGCRQQGSGANLPVWVLFGVLWVWVRRRR